MDTKAAIDKWARDAVTLALYECLLATAARLEQQVHEVQSEACWIKPDEADWLQWRARRRACEGPKREPDPTV